MGVKTVKKAAVKKIKKSISAPKAKSAAAGGRKGT
jgi:hypothetical protein